MFRRFANRLLSFVDAAMAASGHAFLRSWTVVERSYRRPSSWLAYRLKFAFYPLLALGAIGWLAWDWSHERSLNTAENAIFDRVIRWRWVVPKPSGQVLVVEIDECSIEHFRSKGEGGWPWSRQRHAELLDRLDRAGVAAVGFDVLFVDPSRDDPMSDGTLDAMAQGGGGRFLFAATRLHPDYDPGARLRASQVPGAFATVPAPVTDPPVAMLMPYGPAMTRYSAVTNVTRNEDGVLRDVPLYEAAGDWAVPSLPLGLAVAATARPAATFGPAVRPNWRHGSRLPHVSAADLLEAGAPICREPQQSLPALGQRVALVGYTAAGLNDAKPTPVDPTMPGVEVLAEATEALVAGSGIRSPPAGLKYLLAMLLALLTVFAFFRGEPAYDIDSVFVATNLLLIGVAFIGLTFFGFFLDIFAAVGFVSLVFGLCRLYAGVQRGRAVGNGDYHAEYDPSTDRWIAVARLRFVVDRQFGPSAADRRSREYRRRLRRFLYAGSDAVMFEGVVERKSWLHAALDELMILVWHGRTESEARTTAEHDLLRLERELARHDARLPDDGEVLVTFGCAEIDVEAATATPDRRTSLRNLLGVVLAAGDEQPLARRVVLSGASINSPGRS
jgi:CHASE2 domain-containing sensor protein